MVERAIADRLILVDVVNRWFHLQQPIFIDAGHVYCIDHETRELRVDRMTRHAGWMCR